VILSGIIIMTWIMLLFSLMKRECVPFIFVVSCYHASMRQFIVVADRYVYASLVCCCLVIACVHGVFIAHVFQLLGGMSLYFNLALHCSLPAYDFEWSLSFC